MGADKAKALLYNQVMTIFLLCGSIAQKSHTRQLLKYLEKVFQEKGSETIFWDLRENPLPIAIPEYHKDPLKHPEEIVRLFVTEVEKADGVILGSPLYHGSYSGVLKNALDNLRWDAFRHKWVGLVSNTGGMRSDAAAPNHLRQVVNTLVGYGLQTQIATNKDDYEESETEYILVSQAVKERCERLVDEMSTVLKKNAKK